MIRLARDSSVIEVRVEVRIDTGAEIRIDVGTEIGIEIRIEVSVDTVDRNAVGAVEIDSINRDSVAVQAIDGDTIYGIPRLIVCPSAPVILICADAVRQEANRAAVVAIVKERQKVEALIIAICIILAKGRDYSTRRL